VPVVSAAVSDGRFMNLGERAPAPLGYLRFCARRPDQCGLQVEGGDAAAESGAALERRLIGTYFWSVAFATHAAAAPSPTAGVAGIGATLRWASSAPSATTAPSFAPSPGRLVSGPLGSALVLDDGVMALLDRTNLRINESIRYESDESQFGAGDYWTLPLDVGGSGAGDCKDFVLEKRRALVAAGVPDEALSIAIVRTPWGETHAVLLVATDRGELVLDSLSAFVAPWQETHYVWLERQAPGSQLDWVKILPPSRI
jgi:predicted transglutaminase-like cysteine proteinase